MAAHFDRETAAEAFDGSPRAFKNRCYTFLVVLCNEKNFDKAASYLHPDCVLIHEDYPPQAGADNFISSWKNLLKKMPDYHKTILDMVFEPDPDRPGGARVWVYSQITGISEKVRDSIDMMHFTGNGLFFDSKDVQRDTKPSA
jgi:hypothetical protein